MKVATGGTGQAQEAQDGLAEQRVPIGMPTPITSKRDAEELEQVLWFLWFILL